MFTKNNNNSPKKTLENTNENYPNKEFLFLENEKYSTVTNIAENHVRIGLPFESSNSSNINHK